MAKITSIVAQTKRKERCNIYVDDRFYSGLSLECVMVNRLKVGMEIEEEKLKELIFESDKTDALNKALKYISKTLKTKREVKDYLLGKGYTEEIAWYCIDKLKEYNFINDTEYSKRYIESTSKTQGKRLIEYKLMAKGVRKEDISTALDDAQVDMIKNATEIADKYLRNKEKNKENVLKTYRYLISRGFSYEEADSALSKYKGRDD